MTFSIILLLFRYAGEMADSQGISFKKQKPSDGWRRHMKKRHGDLSLRKPEATSALRHDCMNRPYTDKYFQALKAVLVQIKQRTSIWNMDETGVTLCHTPSKCIAR